MAKVGVEGDPDDDIPLGSVHRSHARALGAILWSLAVASIVVVGRYTTLGRIYATIQESWLPLVQVLVVLTVFAVLVPFFRRYVGDNSFSL